NPAGTHPRNIHSNAGDCVSEAAVLAACATPCTPPEIDNPGPQTACGSFSLPVIGGINLTGNEAYYDDSQANNGQVITGPITTSMTVWIYDETGTTPNCFDEVSFDVTIQPQPNAGTNGTLDIC